MLSLRSGNPSAPQKVISHWCIILFLLLHWHHQRMYIVGAIPSSRFPDSRNSNLHPQISNPAEEVLFLQAEAVNAVEDDGDILKENVSVDLSLYPEEISNGLGLIDLREDTGDHVKITDDRALDEQPKYLEGVFVTKLWKRHLITGPSFDNCPSGKRWVRNECREVIYLEDEE